VKTATSFDSTTILIQCRSLEFWNRSQRYEDLIDGERRTLIFTDRNVYRPGDEVKVKSISRFIDTDKLLGAGIGSREVPSFRCPPPRALEREVTYSKNGSFDDAFTLPTEGMGWHSIEVDFNPLSKGTRSPTGGSSPTTPFKSRTTG
jgi:hypothetical protein